MTIAPAELERRTSQNSNDVHTIYKLLAGISNRQQAMANTQREHGVSLGEQGEALAALSDTQRTHGNLLTALADTQKRMAMTLEIQERHIGRIYDKLDGVSGEVAKVDIRLTGRIDELGERLGRVETRLDGVDERFNAVDDRFNAVDNRLDSIEGRFDQKFAETDVKLDRIIELLGTGAR